MNFRSIPYGVTPAFRQYRRNSSFVIGSTCVPTVHRCRRSHFACFDLSYFFPIFYRPFPCTVLLTSFLFGTVAPVRGRPRNLAAGYGRLFTTSQRLRAVGAARSWRLRLLCSSYHITGKNGTFFLFLSPKREKRNIFRNFFRSSLTFRGFPAFFGTQMVRYPRYSSTLEQGTIATQTEPVRRNEPITGHFPHFLSDRRALPRLLPDPIRTAFRQRSTAVTFRHTAKPLTIIPTL